MDKPRVLVVPKELGVWLDGMELGSSSDYYYLSMIHELFHYWETIMDSPIGNFITENEKELIEVIIGSREHKIEESLYYALLKGHELIVDRGCMTPKYWKLDTSNGRVFTSHMFTNRSIFVNEMTKEDWNGIGINDSNADFVAVNEKKRGDNNG